MNSAMILWAVAGLAVVVIMLVVVLVSQSLNKREIADTAKMSAPRNKARTEPSAESTKRRTRKSTASTLVAIGGSIAVLSGVIAFAKEINDGDIAPEVKEIAAGQLHGTMLNARNDDPVVLIVPGSGPTDRDGNNPMGMKTDAYKFAGSEAVRRAHLHRAHRQARHVRERGRSAIQTFRLHKPMSMTSTPGSTRSRQSADQNVCSCSAIPKAH